MFDHTVAELDGKLTDGNRQRVDEAIAKAIIDLATAGQLDATQLSLYAMSQGRTEIVR